jgi:hypothetical protein
MNEILAELKKITELLETLNRRLKDKFPVYEETLEYHLKQRKSMQCGNGNEGSNANVVAGTCSSEAI